MTQQLVACYPTQSIDEVPTISIVEPILIWVVGVRMMIEVMSGGVLYSVLIVGILEDVRTCVMMKRETYSIFLFIIYEGSNSTALIGAVAGLTMNMDSSLPVSVPLATLWQNVLEPHWDSRCPGWQLTTRDLTDLYSNQSQHNRGARALVFIYLMS